MPEPSRRCSGGQPPRQTTLTPFTPLGGSQVAGTTWAQVPDQARRMAAHLNEERGFEPRARIVILSRNCAHFIMAELTTWMAGGTTVAIFPISTPCLVPPRASWTTPASA